MDVFLIFPIQHWVKCKNFFNRFPSNYLFWILFKPSGPNNYFNTWTQCDLRYNSKMGESFSIVKNWYNTVFSMWNNIAVKTCRVWFTLLFKGTIFTLATPFDLVNGLNIEIYEYWMQPSHFTCKLAYVLKPKKVFDNPLSKRGLFPDFWLLLDLWLALKGENIKVYKY